MFNKLKNSNSFLGNVMKVATGTILTQLMGLLLMPVITRLFSPENFGEFGVYIALFGILSPLVGAKFEVALVLEKDLKDKLNLYLLSILSTFFIFLLSFILFWGFNNKFIRLFNLNINADLLIILPFSLLLFGISQANNYLLISNNYFGKISINNVLQKITDLGSKLVFGFLNSSSLGLVISDFLNKIAAFIFTTFIIVRHRWLRYLFKDTNKTSLRNVITKYIKFPTYELLGDWFNSISNQLPILIMAYYFSNAFIGLYVFANGIFIKMVTLTSKNFSSVYYQKISLIKNELERKKFTLKLINNLIAIGIFPFLLIIIGGPQVFSFFFGNKWYDSGIYAQIISPYLFLIYLIKPVNSLYRIYSFQNTFLYFSLINTLLFSFSVFLGGILKSEIGAVIFMTISGMLIYSKIYFWILKKLNISFLEVIRIVIKFLLISSAFLIIPLSLNIFVVNKIYFLFSLLLSTFSFYGYFFFKYKKFFSLN